MKPSEIVNESLRGWEQKVHALPLILAVDDSPTYRHALAALLKKEGYDVVLAESGEQALELIQNRMVDCILLDSIMPALSGQDVCRRIKASPDWRTIPVIMITGREENDVILDCFSAGADDYVSKASEFTVLRARLGVQLRRRQFEAETRRVQNELHRKDVEVTERKRAEQDLRRMMEDLARSNQDLEQFAYVTLHDLKEPLRMVTGFMDLLKEHCQGLLDAKAQEYIGYASSAAARMQGAIDDLLAYARIGRSGAVEATDVAKVVDRALENLNASIVESGARIARDALPTVQANALELTQVFQNLIGNAIKFHHPDRTPEVHIGVRRVSVEEYGSAGVSEYRSGSVHPHSDADTSTRRHADTLTLPYAPFWLFSVRDNGIGIEPQYAERIFLMFHRLHTYEAYPGSGVGLAICKRIVERHGGRIWLESNPGGGATFCFTIPG